MYTIGCKAVGRTRRYDINDMILYSIRFIQGLLNHQLKRASVESFREKATTGSESCSAENKIPRIGPRNLSVGRITKIKVWIGLHLMKFLTL